MSKTISISIKSVTLLCLIAMSIGCNQSQTNTFPATTPTSTSISSLYNHYTSSDDLYTGLEFDYPIGWAFKETGPDLSGTIMLNFIDSSYLILPTESSEFSHTQPNSIGSLRLLVSPSQSIDTLETKINIEDIKRSNDASRFIIFLNGYKTKIDGYDAIIIEQNIKPSDEYDSLMFARSAYFIAKSRYYDITYIIAEKDRGGEFEHGYTAFMSSLKVLP